MDLRSWIREEHSGLRVAYETVAGSVPIDRLTERPISGGNSIAWLLWHVARWQDVAVNTIVRGEPQVFISGAWGDRLGLSSTRTGTGFTDEEVEEWSRSVEVDQLTDYWAAVARETAAWLNDIDLDVLDGTPDVDAHLRSAPTIVGEQGEWVYSFFRGRPARFFVGFTAINHAYMHIGEMSVIRSALGIAGL